MMSVAGPAVAELVGGGRGTRYPYKPIGLTLAWQMSKMTAAGTESIAGCGRIAGPGSTLSQCRGYCDAATSGYFVTITCRGW